MLFMLVTVATNAAAAPDYLRSASTFSADDTLLEKELVARGVEVAGNSSRLRCFARHLQRGGPATVAALGGSVSAGLTAGVWKGKTSHWLYHHKVVSALGRQFSGKIRHHNGALPATGPQFVEHCIDDLLPADVGAQPTLVLVEFAPNIDDNPAAFERLLRKLLALRAAVVVVNTHVFNVAHQSTGKLMRRVCWRHRKGLGGPVSLHEPEQLAVQEWRDVFFHGAEDHIAKLCSWYGVPLVSVRAALLDAAKANRSTAQHSIAKGTLMALPRCERGGHAVLCYAML